MNAFDKAHKVVHGLCDGSIDWTMRIPADEGRDPDLVISKALRLGDRSVLLLKKSLIFLLAYQNINKNTGSMINEIQSLITEIVGKND